MQQLTPQEREALMADMRSFFEQDEDEVPVDYDKLADGEFSNKDNVEINRN